MNKLKLSLFSIIILLFLSCSKSETNADSKEAGAASETSKLIIEALYPVNDKIEVYYLKPNDGEDFKVDQKIDYYVYKSPEIQKIEVELPKNTKIKKLRVDLSGNKNLKNLTIKNISFVKGDKVVDGDNGKFRTDWFFNEFITYDENNFEFILNENNGVYDPYIISNENLVKKLNEINKP